MNQQSREPSVLLASIDALWQRAWPALTLLDDEELATPIAGGEWSPKDVMAHMARWEDWHREAIQEHLAGQPKRSYDGYNTWNETWAAEDKAMSSSDARMRLQTAHTDLVGLIARLEPATWDETVYAFAEQCTLNHFPDHLEWLATPGQANRG